MSGREKQISVEKSNYNVQEKEFDNMRDRFENEMRRVEEEMGRLRREFEGYTPRMTQNQNGTPAPAIQQHPRNTPQPTTHHSSSHSTVSNVSGGGRRYDPYLDNIKSPLIRDDSDGKTIRLRFDVALYKPEEVTVKTVDNRLLVHAKHEEKSAQRTVYREYNQEFMLPRGTNAEYITSSLSVDGILTVEAPLPAMAIENQQQPQSITH